MLLRKKTYQISLAAVIVAGFLFFNPIQTQAVEWIIITPDPIFKSIVNFLPKDSELSEITIKNNSDTRSYERITLKGELIEGGLAPALELKVDNLLWVNLDYLLENDFVLVLPGALPVNGERKFDFTIRFKEEGEEIDNFYQNKSVNFNFIFTFEGDLSTPLATMVVPGGGGGGLPPGLIIQYEKAYEIGDTWAKIEWWTSYNATSQVIYAKSDEARTLNLNDNVGAPPKYGYARTTEEFHTPANTNGVLYRKIRIDGLASGTTYYYRAVSHASPPTVSKEHTFTTLALADGGNRDSNEHAPDFFQGGNNGGAGGIYPRIRGAAGVVSDFISSLFGSKTKGIEGRVAGAEENENADESKAGENETDIIKPAAETGSEAAGECGKYPAHLLWLIVLLLLIIIILLYHIYQNKKRTQRINNAL